MRIDHRRSQITMAEKLLDRANVRAIFQEMRRKGMPQGMARHAPRDASPLDRRAKRPLNHRLMEMVPAALASGVDEGSPRREDELPRPLEFCLRILAHQGRR